MDKAAEEIRSREAEIDKLVGQNIRTQRLAAGVSQRELSAGLGITFQQIQKFEQGKNRIGAGRLGLVAEILKCPLDQLYTDPNGEQEQSQLDVVDLSLIRRLGSLDPQFQTLIRRLINQMARCDCDTGHEK